MFEIFDTQVNSTKAPKQVHIDRLLRKKNEVEELSICAEYGEAWAGYSDELKQTKIRSLIVYDFDKCKSYEWLKSFSYLKKLYLHTNNLPSIEVFDGFSALDSLSLGVHPARGINDFSVLGEALTNISSLTLTGNWTNLNLLPKLGINELYLNCFSSDEKLFLSGSHLEFLSVYRSPGFNFNNMKSLMSLKGFELLSKFKTEGFPDLTKNTAILKAAFFDKKNLQECSRRLPKTTEIQAL